VTLARRYLWCGLGFLAFGGFLAMGIRAQLAFPEFTTPIGYQRFFTMHGLVMIFWAATPLLFGALGNTIITPKHPRVARAAFWVFALSGVLMLASFAVPLGTATAGWTSYPPLSTSVPGLGPTLVALAVALSASSTWLTSLNLAVSAQRTTLTHWGYFLASLLNIVFLPVLLVACALMLSDRLLGTGLFTKSGDAMLYQHLFWIFGHPEVYVLILPVWGIVSDLLAHFSGREPWFYRGSVGALCAIAALSGLVYGHHLYHAGLSPLLGRAFMTFTLLISLPAMLLVFNWLQTLRGGDLRLTTPMLFALGMLFVFSLGGITGLSLATPLTNVYLHDTLYVVGHFHLTLAGSALLGVFAALYHWAPQLIGRALDERWGRVHFALTFVLFVIVFSGVLAAGWAGQSRRLADPYAYDFIKPLVGLNRWTTYFAWALGTSQLVFAASFFKAARR
jgi:cytochrome c oxidase subunit I